MPPVAIAEVRPARFLRVPHACDDAMPRRMPPVGKCQGGLLVSGTAQEARHCVEIVNAARVLEPDHLLELRLNVHVAAFAGSGAKAPHDRGSHTARYPPRHGARRHISTASVAHAQGC